MSNKKTLTNNPTKTQEITATAQVGTIMRSKDLDTPHNELENKTIQIFYPPNYDLVIGSIATITRGAYKGYSGIIQGRETETKTDFKSGNMAIECSFMIHIIDLYEVVKVLSTDIEANDNPAATATKKQEKKGW